MARQKNEPMYLVMDKRGRGYRLEFLEASRSWQVKAYHLFDVVAEATFELDPPLMRLNQIVVKDAVVYRGYPMTRLIRRLFFWPNRPKSYRNRGLGSILLSFLMDWGHQRGCTIIQGRISASDLVAFPILVEWFRKKGFHVQTPDPSGAREIESRLP